jgi:transcriptional regulator with XRE-family HTH domain
VHYRAQIKTDFLKRSEKNKRYSLRAFARDLQVDAGQLSAILKGKKKLSLAKASEVSKLLFKTPRERLLTITQLKLSLLRKKKSRIKSL